MPPRRRRGVQQDAHVRTWRRHLAAQARANPPRQRRQRKQKKRGGKAPRNSRAFAMSHAVDATRNTHVPGPIALGPYSVIRGHTTFSMTTNTAGQYHVGLFGPHTVELGSGLTLFNQVISPVIGITGVGVDVPNVTEIARQDGTILPYAASMTGTVANAALHAMTIVVNSGATASSAEGLVYLGAINQPVRRTRFATWNDVALTLLARREPRPMSGYNILSCPPKVSGYPVDVTDWSIQRPVHTAAGGSNVSMDAMSQVALVLAPTTNAVTYSVTVFTEWRINFTDPVLSSTATMKPVVPQAAWNGSACGQRVGRLLLGRSAEGGRNVLELQPRRLVTGRDEGRVLGGLRPLSPCHGDEGVATADVSRLTSR